MKVRSTEPFTHRNAYGHKVSAKLTEPLMPLKHSAESDFWRLNHFGTGVKRLITDGFVLHAGCVPRPNPYLHASMGADRPFDTVIIIYREVCMIMIRYKIKNLLRHFRKLLALLMALSLIFQLSAVKVSAVSGEQSEVFEASHFRFRIPSGWETEESELSGNTKHFIFRAEDGFSIHALEVPNRVDPEVIDGFQENICALCEIPCPAGDGLKTDLYHSRGFSDETLLFDIYDDQNYVKGGVFSDETNTLIIAADCTELTADHDIAFCRLMATVQPAGLGQDEPSAIVWEGEIAPESGLESAQDEEELSGEAEAVNEEEPERIPVQLVILTGVKVPEELTGGVLLALDPGTADEASPVQIIETSILKSSDDGEEDPYILTEDTEAEAGMYYAGRIVLEADEGYYFEEGTEVQLFGDAEDSETVISYENISVNENGQLIIELAFGQAMEAEPEALGSINVSVPVAEYGKAAVKPEDILISEDDGQGSYMLTFGEWSGNFDEAGNFREAETYTLPVTVTAMPGYFIGPETEVYVNGVCLLGADSVEELETAELYYTSATASQPNSYWIILNNVHTSMKSSSIDWMPVSEASAGQQVLVSVYPDPGYSVDSVNVSLTNDPETQIPAELLNRQGSSAVFGFGMPEGSVTVSANLISPPPAEMPQAQLTVTGPSSGVLTNVDGSMKWSRDGAEYIPVSENIVEISGLRPDMQLYVVRIGDGVQSSDSEPQIITITQAAEPEGLTAVACRSEENRDGIIYGLDAGMEWRASGEEEFTEITEGETALEDLAPGTYEFRSRFTETMLASDIVTVQVDAYDPEAYYELMLSGAAAYVAEDVEIRQAREGDIVTIRAEASKDSAFNSWSVWTVDEEAVALEDPKNSETSFMMPADSVLVLARFEDDIDLGYAYLIEYDGCGADKGSMGFQVFYEKEEQQLRQNAFIREELVFAGWADSPDAETAVFEDGELITGPLAEKEGQIRTLYAVWQTPPPPEYKILVSGGTAYIDGEAVTTAPEGAEVTIKAEEKSGKAFVKWLDNDNLIAEFDRAETTFIMPAHDIVIVAQHLDSQHVIYKVDDEFAVHILKVPYTVNPYAVQAYYKDLYALCGVDDAFESVLNAAVINTRNSSDAAGLFYIYDEQHYIKGNVYSDGTYTIYVTADCSELIPERDAVFNYIRAAYQRADLAWDQTMRPEGTEDIEQIELTAPDAVSGEVPERPGDYLGIQNDHAAYMVVFDDWKGSFDDEGRCQAGESYTLPITIAALPGYALSPEIQISVNGTPLAAAEETENIELIYLDHTVEMPASYSITLINENAQLQGFLEDGTEITEALSGQEVFIRVNPEPGYMADSIYILRTDDSQKAADIQAELVSRENNAAVFSFVMPGHGVTIGSKLTGLPKAETPEAEYTVTGDDTGTLSNVDSSMKWSQDGIVYTQVSGNPEELTGIRSKVIYVIRSGDGILTTDSDPQKIYIK